MSSYKELQEKTDKDLMKLLSEKRTALRNFRFGVAGSKIRNVKEGVAIEKDIARILTLLQTKKA
ncbi:MAG: 50S ribosomal protein L29 [Patescibacteria group bacterium]